ncbi:MAG: fasciclin domain-containing protein [Bacteroidota bacterium]|nr:fasciclin domain-containing protein [Bacteroidota bacterium]
MKTRSLTLKSAGVWMFIALIAFSTFSSCKKNDNNVPQTPGTITDVVSANTSFSILKAAVVKAGLATTLSGTGPFTVFAPGDDAFTAAGITMSTINTLTADQLKSILLYHTLAAKVMAADVPAGPNAAVATAGGDSVYVTKNSKGVFVNGVPVVKADIAASNGVIHSIGGVLMPPPGNIVVVAQSDTSLSYLVAAVLRASQGTTNVAQVLSGNGPYTVFAPTNNAFRAAGFATVSAINSADPNTLAGILTYHVVAGRVFSSDLTDGAQPATLNGGKVTIGLTSGATVKGKSNMSASNIVMANIVATNGVIHVIDQVLLP